MFRVPKTPWPTTLVPAVAPPTGYEIVPRSPILNGLVNMTISVFLLILLAPPTGRYY